MRCQQRSANELFLVKKSVGNDAAILRHQIKKRIAEFFSLDRCHYVTRAEITTRGKELVICCAEGKGLKDTVRALIANAAKLGFDYVRYHPKTARAGAAMARIAGETVTVVQEQNAYYLLIDLRGRYGRQQVEPNAANQ